MVGGPSEPTRVDDQEKRQELNTQSGEGPSPGSIEKKSEGDENTVITQSGLVDEWDQSEIQYDDATGEVRILGNDGWITTT